MGTFRTLFENTASNSSLGIAGGYVSLTGPGRLQVESAKVAPTMTVERIAADNTGCRTERAPGSGYNCCARGERCFQTRSREPEARARDSTRIITRHLACTSDWHPCRRQPTPPRQSSRLEVALGDHSRRCAMGRARMSKSSVAARNAHLSAISSMIFSVGFPLPWPARVSIRISTGCSHA
jgi:hypothetical protein